MKAKYEIGQQVYCVAGMDVQGIVIENYTCFEDHVIYNYVEQTKVACRYSGIDEKYLSDSKDDVIMELTKNYQKEHCRLLVQKELGMKIANQICEDEI